MVDALILDILCHIKLLYKYLIAYNVTLEKHFSIKQFNNSTLLRDISFETYGKAYYWLSYFFLKHQKKEKIFTVLKTIMSIFVFTVSRNFHFPFSIFKMHERFLNHYGLFYP